MRGDPTKLAIMPMEAILHDENRTFVKGFLVDFQAHREVFRVHPLCPSVAEFLLYGTPPEIKPRPIDESAFLVKPGHPDEDRRHIRNTPESCFAFLQRLLEGFFFGNVAYKSRDSLLAFNDGFAHGDLHGNGGSNIAQRREFTAKPGNYRLPHEYVGRKIIIAASTEGGRHEHANIPPDQFLSLIAKNAHDGKIGGFDLTPGIGGDDSLHGIVKYGVKDVLIGPTRQFVGFSRGVHWRICGPRARSVFTSDGDQLL